MALHLPTALKQHKQLSIVTVAALVLMALICLLPMSSGNLHYELSFGQSVEPGASATFQFEGTENLPEYSSQTAFVRNGTASIRVDSINQDSQSLSITVEGANASVSSFTARMVITDQISYTVHSVPADHIVVSSDSDGNTSVIALDESSLQKIQHNASLLAPIKFFLLGVLLIAYTVFLLRKTFCKTADIRIFTAGTVVAVLLIGVTCNVWLVKQPISQNTQFQYDETAPITANEFELQQTLLIKGDYIDYIELPVELAYSVSPADEQDSKYSDVYKSPQEFQDVYTLTITTDNDTTSLFSGRVTPDLLNAELDAIRIPLQVHGLAGHPLTITLHKEASDKPSSLAFSVGTISQSDGTITAAQITGDMTEDEQYLVVSAGYNGMPYREYITIIIAALVIVLGINILATRYRRQQTQMLVSLFNYAILFPYIIFQNHIYQANVQGFADEQAHLSYIAFLEKEGGIIPDFSRMGIYSSTATGIDTAVQTQFNYLGHPPLYYLIMRFLGQLSVDGTVVTFNLNRLRTISFCIGLLAILLLFYIGFTRIRKIPILHLLFGLLIISPPNLIYGISGVSNDTLTFLTVAIFILGIIRFLEHRYNFATYSLIAIGISTTVLTKLTSGMIVCILAVFVVLYTIVKERKPERIFNLRFASSLPFYLIPIAYFAVLYSRFHTVQPSYAGLALDEYMQSGMYQNIDTRLEMGVWEYCMYYIQRFLDTWYTIAGHTAVARPSEFFTYGAVLAILIIPFALYVMRRNRSRDYLCMAFTAVVLVMLYQMFGSAYASFINNGYAGGYSSRYYLCAIPVMAFACIYVIVQCCSQRISPTTLEPWRTSNSQQLTQIGVLICSMFAVLLVLDGFIFSVLYDADLTRAFIG